MNFDDEDRLELQHLAGGSIVEHAPVFSEQGRFIFVRCNQKVQVFVTSTGELTRELDDATSPLISLELDVKHPDLLLGCTSSGQMLRWHWRTGVVQKEVMLNLDSDYTEVVTCNLLNLYKGGDTACAFVTAKHNSANTMKWFVFNTNTGAQIDVNCSLKLRTQTPVVDVSKGAFKYIAIAQFMSVHFVQYETWECFSFKNRMPLTCIRLSPFEQMAAIGTQYGQVLIWRQFDKPESVQRTIYHWHSSAVTCIAFTPTGMSFYSGGLERVLVKWSLTSTQERSFLPRMSSVLKHIVISDGNEKLLVCTADNALQFVDPNEMKLLSTLQHFTYALSDNSDNGLFPIGLCLNPRTNSLVLNGRIGQLQFYSAYTKSLLYNLRVVEGNVQSAEPKTIIYNTCVTRAAFNINWMATGEVYNDQQNFPELQLKFWQYQEKLQTYKLNTNIELPHQDGFVAIVFSNQFQVDNLRCASAGKDNVIKLWTLGDSENIYKRSVMWTCEAQASYKQQRLESICFSQDGSLLAAGYGHTLVLFDARTLRLLHALSTSAGYDGVVSKAQVRLSHTAINGTRTELVQQRQQLWGLLQTLLNSNDKKLVQQAQQLMASPSSSNQNQRQTSTAQEPSKQEIFKHIMQMAELGLHQKLQLLRHFDIECYVSTAYQKSLKAHLQMCGVEPQSANERVRTLNERLHRLQPRQRFKAKVRLLQLKKRRQNYELDRHEILPLFSMLQLDETTKPAEKVKRINKSGKLDKKSNKSLKLVKSIKSAKADNSAGLPYINPFKKGSMKAKESDEKLAPLQGSAQISHVQFGSGAQAHLVAVCTETRVLIWNLMTLRLQAGLKLSVRQLAFDPLTNLIAAVTRNNELHVFQPNVPLPIYQRSNLPLLHGLVWLPRRQPKQSSINVDWQAQSTLHMLTNEKEIVYLALPGQTITDDAPAPISFAQPADEQLLQYATFGAFVARQKNTENTEIAQRKGPLIVGRGVHSSVNALVNLSAHTMPAMSLICGEFIKSLLTPGERDEPNETNELPLSNGKLNGNGYTESQDDDEDEEEENADLKQEDYKEMKTELRKVLLDQNSALEKINNKEVEQQTLDARLQRVAKHDVILEF
ncbi:WD repeat-containing protein 75 [Drosophila sulfurigaster albostrigata]|uniref:WD repeat-containing protein 75 n=1 Tax=Drosophila sulfurigaster albostrigata TaxID=89887 RepID=UPI002D21B813|nr:WD repeat-containing protein 75 [Drosophila sulfurigaster albostrigata]